MQGTPKSLIRYKEGQKKRNKIKKKKRKKGKTKYALIAQRTGI
jgi:hypothetical protein